MLTFFSPPKAGPSMKILTEKWLLIPHFPSIPQIFVAQFTTQTISPTDIERSNNAINSGLSSGQYRTPPPPTTGNSTGHHHQPSAHQPIMNTIPTNNNNNNNIVSDDSGAEFGKKLVYYFLPPLSLSLSAYGSVCLCAALVKMMFPSLGCNHQRVMVFERFCALFCSYFFDWHVVLLKPQIS